MAQVTRSLIEKDFLPACQRKEFPPITIWEIQQLCVFWLNHQPTISGSEGLDVYIEQLRHALWCVQENPDDAARIASIALAAAPPTERQGGEKT